MQIIPTINCQTFSCAKERVLKFKTILKSLPAKERWIQVDISDGKFTTAKSWNNPKELKKWAQKNKITLPNLEVHLMVNNPLPEIKKWNQIGAKRLIIHAEVLNDKLFKEIKKDKKLKIGIAINPDSKVVDYKAWIEKFDFVQILAVNPGFSGQKIKADVLNKAAQIRKINPNAQIEIDGGMDGKTLPKAKAKGINFATSASYVLESKNSEVILNKYR